MEKYSPDKGHFCLLLAIMEKSDPNKPMEKPVNRMHDKLCPFDKQPCIGERCEVFREEAGICSFSLIGIPGKPLGPQKDEPTSSKYRARLFD
jgi:hypothetical protein